MPVSRPSSLRETVFSSRFLWAWGAGLCFSAGCCFAPCLAPPLLPAPFWPFLAAGAGAALGSGRALFRKADRSASLFWLLRRSSKRFSSFSSRVELFFLSLIPAWVKVSRIFLTERPVSFAKSVTLYFTIIRLYPPRI